MGKLIILIPFKYYEIPLCKIEQGNSKWKGFRTYVTNCPTMTLGTHQLEYIFLAVYHET